MIGIKPIDIRFNNILILMKVAVRVNGLILLFQHFDALL
jgi:hypothetical protein